MASWKGDNTGSKGERESRNGAEAETRAQDSNAPIAEQSIKARARRTSSHAFPGDPLVSAELYRID